MLKHSARLARQPQDLDHQISFIYWQFTRDTRFLPKLLEHLSDFDQPWQRIICCEAAAVLRGRKEINLRTADKRLKAIGIALAVENDRPKGVSISTFLASLKITNDHGDPLGDEELIKLMTLGRKLIGEVQKTFHRTEK